jgi:hypothetical protein
MSYILNSDFIFKKNEEHFSLQLATETETYRYIS